jgi:hypothetical protein
MAFYAEDSGGTFERCPPGMHLARCYRIIDLGTQKTEYMGQTKYLHKIMIGWEIHGNRDDGSKLLMQDNRPFAIFKNYTLSWSEKANLRLDLQSWRGKPFTQEEMRRFDLTNVLGAWCMLNIIERPAKTGNKIYSNVDGVTPVPALIKQNGLPAAVNKNEMFNLTEPDMALFESFSDNLKAKIQSSPEWQKIAGTQAPAQSSTPAPASKFDDMDDDIPF